ncbi:conserved hypothetical protein [Lacticaseibacillus rhamnosus ATCC 8530]|nr:conserved hypothetical protein [Lacticaseibacillus rhamnosus ATCC 8530]
MAKARPSRLRPLTLRLLNAPARAYQKRVRNLRCRLFIDKTLILF